MHQITTYIGIAGNGFVCVGNANDLDAPGTIFSYRSYVREQEMMLPVLPIECKWTDGMFCDIIVHRTAPLKIILGDEIEENKIVLDEMELIFHQKVKYNGYYLMIDLSKIQSKKQRNCKIYRSQRNV